jgi:hypothetical protein
VLNTKAQCKLGPWSINVLEILYYGALYGSRKILGEMLEHGTKLASLLTTEWYLEFDFYSGGAKIDVIGTMTLHYTG